MSEQDNALDKELLEVLACPACKVSVEQKGDRLICDQCGRQYPVRDGIPIMLMDEAEQPEGQAG
jgi:hypothetical protein